MAKVMIEGWECERCGHRWVPREPGFVNTSCPACKSPYWNKPRQTPKPKTAAKKSKKS